MNLKYQFSNNARLNLLLILMSGFCFFLSIFRVLISGTSFFLFLNWNLFLAAIPYLLTYLLAKPNTGKLKIFNLVGMSVIWLLFFPNAPYILTDLFHLRIASAVPKWFDLILIISFAWTGLLFGFLSLMKIERLYQKFLSAKQVNYLSFIVLFLASFGVYLGRFLRWNSWDVIQNPFSLLFDISDRIIHPFTHLRTWGVTFLFGIMLNIIYWTVKLLRFENNSKKESREDYFII